MAVSSPKKVSKAKPKASGKGSGKTTQKPKKAIKRTASKKTTVSNVGLKKEYLKTRKSCKVTFRLPSIAAEGAKHVYIVGDFNNWNMYDNPMRKLKNGDFTITLELEPEREYQFRYLIDELKWENDWNADKYEKSPYGDSDNSVVIV